jgi:GT2 family glycosyltransferase
MGSPPRFSLFISVSNDEPALLEQTLKSVVAQYYPWWHLVITCKEKPDAHITAVLNHYERNDERIVIQFDNNKAKIAKDVGEAIQTSDSIFTLFIEQGDLLTEHALYLIAYRVRKASDVQLYYSDYDHIDRHGLQSDPCFKTEWNYDLFLGKNYLQYLTAYRTETLKEILKDNKIDPFRHAAKLNLLFVESYDAGQILHLPYILMHRRRNESEIDVDTDPQLQHDKRALEGHLKRTNQTASALPVRGGFHIKRGLPEEKPLVSLIVLTRDRVALLSNCIDGLLENTSYKNIEIIIIDNGSKEESTLEYLEAIRAEERVNVLRHDIEFNFSELNNFGVKHASGDCLGLINNDISVIEPGWLDEMMGHLIRPEVGVVGARLLYENNTVQHAGVIVGLGGVAGHAFRHEPHHARGYDDRLILCQELSCVTAACILTKKDVYKEVEGLDEINLRVAFNDVDYCLKVRDKGYKVIWTPFAELYHLESASRGHDLSKDNIDRWQGEYDFMRNKWRNVLEWDPFYNPNLAITDEDFSLAQPPRLIHPWDRHGF